MTSHLEKFVEKFGRLPTETDPDYLEMLRMSKYKILATPYYKPGKCANCGASKDDGRKYIDFGLEVDWYGIVYICGSCLSDVANAVGLFDRLNLRILDLEKALEEEKKNKTSLDELKEKGVEIQETIISRFRELEDFYVSVHPPRNDSTSDSSSDLGDESTAEPESAVNESKPRTVKSTSSTGRKDVPSLASLIDADK